MGSGRARYHLNVAGDFYVEDGCCTLCGVPATTAPTLFGGFEADGSVSARAEQCWVDKQPSCPEELDAMIETFAVQEFDCIRYSGTDREISRRLHEIAPEAVDEP